MLGQNVDSDPLDHASNIDVPANTLPVQKPGCFTQQSKVYGLNCKVQVHLGRVNLHFAS